MLHIPGDKIWKRVSLECISELVVWATTFPAGKAERTGTGWLTSCLSFFSSSLLTIFSQESESQDWRSTEHLLNLAVQLMKIMYPLLSWGDPVTTLHPDVSAPTLAPSHSSWFTYWGILFHTARPEEYVTCVRQSRLVLHSELQWASLALLPNEGSVYGWLK